MGQHPVVMMIAPNSSKERFDSFVIVWPGFCCIFTIAPNSHQESKGKVGILCSHQLLRFFGEYLARPWIQTLDLPALSPTVLSIRPPRYLQEIDGSVWKASTRQISAEIFHGVRITPKALDRAS